MATSSIMAKFTANEAKAADALASFAAVFRKIAPVDGKAILFGSRARFMKLDGRLTRWSTP